MTRATSKTRASLSFNARQNNSVLVDASADFVEPLIFTNIKVIIARLFYERDYKTFTDFRLFFNLRQESPQLIERKTQVDTDAQETSRASKYSS